MKKNLIIHGHFYQPPREDPWTGLISQQESATPYHDWNERITRECYAANAVSRVLNSAGQIVDIINNYRYLSFNFGPTLLSWMERETPNIYHKILQADELSLLDQNGHGNAVAQVYNHIIMPLANDADKKTQILWGLEDFSKRFKRTSEGIWLAETAINMRTAELLVQEGISYVILSPWQARAIKDKDQKKWTSLDGSPAPCSEAYKLATGSGDLSVFFYHPDLASGISFNHYLRDADNLLSIINNEFDNIQGNMINVATDGEIYGHHEPFGDMCLASLIKKINGDSNLEFTNYGHYLEKNPPVKEVQLHTGEEDRGTSWSCSHGVSRWYKDCGCHTGGGENWNQSWRGPLRNAFDHLQEILWSLYIQEIPNLTLTDPVILRNEYIKVLTQQSTKDDFCKKHLNEYSQDNSARLIRLLEGQKYSLFMYTSCGWFFSELSGIEPVQNIKYALKSAEIYQEFTPVNLTKILANELENSKSNIPEKKDGKNILNKDIIQNKDPLHMVAGLFLSMHAIKKELKSYGIWEKGDIFWSEDSKKGEITLLDKELQKEFTLPFSILPRSHSLLPEIFLFNPKNEEEEELPFFPENLPLRIKEMIADDDPLLLTRTKLEKILQVISPQVEYEKLQEMANWLPSSLIAETINIYFNYTIISLILHLKYNPQRQGDVDRLQDILDNFDSFKLMINKDRIEENLQNILGKRVERFISLGTKTDFEFIMKLLKIAYKAGINPVKPSIQDVLFEFLREEILERRKISEELKKVADYFNLSVQEVEQETS